MVTGWRRMFVNKAPVVTRVAGRDLAIPGVLPPSRGLSGYCSVARVRPFPVETRVPSLVGKDALEEEMATHSTILARKTPWTEEP